ncbi:hypothetical protein C0Q70_07374 [Pomacea canaliculata]|uniref:Uncharacterized protein n=1 Tax=Pomacea canaliculata TaxID=400727 RepID=A0A2T7PEV5_POMCA|nr:hypothetical protein C0Q70_07374 [Pomacea canaliculata]
MYPQCPQHLQNLSSGKRKDNELQTRLRQHMIQGRIDEHVIRNMDKRQVHVFTSLCFSAD